MSSASRFDPPTGLEASTLERLSAALDTFRLLDPKMSSSYMAAFLAVCRKPGVGPSEYARMTGTVQPVISRILLDLGPKSRDGGGPGLGLVDRVVSETSLRNVKYFLTTKGKQLESQLVRYLTNA